MKLTKYKTNTKSLKLNTTAFSFEGSGTQLSKNGKQLLYFLSGTNGISIEFTREEVEIVINRLQLGIKEQDERVA